MISKTQLRKQVAQLVSNTSVTERREQSRLVLNKLLGHPKYQQANRLSIYLSTENELDTRPILEHALGVGGKQCFIPLVRKPQKLNDGDPATRMIMVELKSMQDYQNLPVNNYGIKEPEVCGLRAIANPQEANLDLVLVPGVAFALDGRRLGHGRGYYDEFLADWAARAQRPLYSIGLALREQLVEEQFPTIEGHDFVLDEVLAG